MKKKSSLVLCAVVLLLSMASCTTETTTQTSSINSTQTDSLTPTQASTENTTSTASSSTASEDTTSENRVYFDDFSIVLPENWCYEENASSYSVVFYEKQVYEETSYGMLVGIAKYDQMLPGTTLGSEYLGEHNGYYFYSGSPTSPDVDTSDTELLNLWNTAFAQVDEVLGTIEWSDNEESGGELITINTNDTLTFTGTLSQEYYEINSNNKGTVNILELDSPFSCYLNDGGFNYDGKTEYLIDSIQVNFYDGFDAQEYYGTNITVTGSVVLAHTAHHKRDIVLSDCNIENTNIIYSSNVIQKYNGKVYYRSGRGTNEIMNQPVLDFSDTDLDYIELPLDYDRGVQSFIIYKDMIYYICEYINYPIQSVGTIPCGCLFQCDLSGNNRRLIAEFVDNLCFYIQNDILYFNMYNSANIGSSSLCSYDLSIDLDNASSVSIVNDYERTGVFELGWLFRFDENSGQYMEFDGGYYYYSTGEQEVIDGHNANTYYYRKDIETGEVIRVGYSFNTTI